jgi:hypothetical protein
MPFPSVIAIVREVIAEPLVAFVWWYGTGGVRALARLRERLREGNEYLGWSVWLKSLFTPMYGQYDAVGRVISFIIRLLQILLSTALMIVWVTASVALYVLYLLLPVFAVAMIAYELSMVRIY